MKFYSDILAKAGLIVDGITQLNTIANASTDTDKFIVSDSGVIKYRTGSEVLSDIGAQPLISNPVTGTGTSNYVTKWTGSSAIGNSQIFDDGTSVGINNASPSSTYKLDVSGNVQIVGKIYANQNTQASTPFVFDMNTRYGSGTDGFLIRGYYSDAGTGPYHNPLTVLSPSMNTGERTYINIGRANSTYNRGQIGFWYNGAGSSDNHITFGFWGVENILTIKAGGNVQIGTSGVDAGYKLDINGNLRVQTIANATTDTDRFLVSDSGLLKYRTGSELLSDIGAQPALTNPVTGTGTTNYLPKWTGTTALGNSLVYDDGTNVGVGTASPAYKLDVNGVIKSATGLYVGPVNYAAASINVSSFTTKSNFANSVMTLSSTETGSGGIYPTQIIFAQEGATVGWSIQSVNQGVAYTPLILNPNGSNVLIGTKTDAGYKLDVNGNTRVSGNVLATNLYAGTRFYLSRSDQAGVPNSVAGYTVFDTNNRWNFYTSTNTLAGLAGSSVGSFAGGGDDISFAYGSVTVGSSSQRPATTMYGSLVINESGDDHDVRIEGDTDANLFFTDASADRVGIGTASPASGYKLDVNGGIRSSTGDIQIFKPVGQYYPQLSFFSNGVSGSSLQGYLTRLYVYAAGSVYMNPGGTGNLLIGTNTDAGYKLDVSGTLRSTTSAYFATTSGAVGVNTTSVDSSALFQVDSTTKGILPPRMTSTQRAAISTPAVGLLVYQTDGTEGTYEYASTGWRIINAASSGGVTDGDKGDITVSGSGATWTIDNTAVTYAKIQNVADNRILGRSAGSAGTVQEITIGTGLSLSSGTLTATGTSYSVASVSTTHTETATSGTKVLKADTTGGVFTITLPTAVGNTATIIIKKVAGSATLTIDGSGSETIDGGTTASIVEVYESVTLISDNSNWQII